MDEGERLAGAGRREDDERNIRRVGRCAALGVVQAGRRRGTDGDERGGAGRCGSDGRRRREWWWRCDRRAKSGYARRLLTACGRGDRARPIVLRVDAWDFELRTRLQRLFSVRSRKRVVEAAGNSEPAAAGTKGIGRRNFVDFARRKQPRAFVTALLRSWLLFTGGTAPC